ncbi:MAG: type II toxin-antitoxin system RelE/ParE family toxin [Bdellovibrionaceae bacterium]|jgi:phage-related protein|nr:type II toxin-antitoxin system RelE/ParE family toxin [Pseudobdellovibrionaceae bacterium]
MKIKAPSGGYRLLYATINKDRLIILHGFKKKTQKTPLKEKSVALKRLKEYL